MLNQCIKNLNTVLFSVKITGYGQACHCLNICGIDDHQGNSFQFPFAVFKNHEDEGIIISFLSMLNIIEHLITVTYKILIITLIF